MTTTTDPHLTLMQWLSPAFPVGAFSFSHGLEGAVSEGAVSSPDTFAAWLRDVLEFGAGRADAILLAAAYKAPDDAGLGDVDALARALAPSAERLLETEEQGASFARMTSAIWGEALPALTYPVAVGRAAALQSLPLEMTARAYVQAFAANLCFAAARLVPIGQTDAQRNLMDVTPLCIEIADAALTAGLDDIGTASFASDIQSMRHETQYSRLFRS